MNFLIPKPINCLISVDPETKLWIGHCLNFGLVTSGKTRQSAWINLKGIVKLHIEHSYTHDRDGLTRHSAPDDAFAAFMGLSVDRELRDRIDLDLISPSKPTGNDDIWINGVEIGYTETAGIPRVH